MPQKNYWFSALYIGVGLLVLTALYPEQCWAQFKTLKPGIETRDLKLQSGIFTSELVVLRFDPKIWRVKAYRSQAPKSASEVCSETKSDVAINANFFGTDLQPLGLIVSNSKVLHSLQLGGRTLTGVFLQTAVESKIVHRENFKLSDDILDAIQAGPRLIADGQLISIPDDVSTRRSAIGIDSKGRILFFASKDRFPGLTLKELQQILINKDLDIKDALNLDGGGSSQLYGTAQSLGSEIDVSGGDKVPVFLILRKSTL